MTDALLHAASACWPALARTLKDLEEAKADLASTRNELEYVKSAHGGTARSAMDQLREAWNMCERHVAFCFGASA